MWPCAIAHVDEDERPEIAHAVDPAEQHDVAADVGGAKRAAGVRAREVTELFSHVCIPGAGRDSGPDETRDLGARHDLLLAGRKILDGHFAARRFVVADDGHEANARASRRT